MRKLDLDFGIQRRRSAWTGWVLLLAGLALWVEMGTSYIQLQQEMSSLEETLLKSGAAEIAAKQRRGTDFAPEEFQQAREITAKIGVPWNDLFKAVETVKAGRVVLLAIEPDPKTGKLLLRGEAADLPSLLTYVARLGQTQQLREVYLAQHEIKQGFNPSYPVSFSINARWGDVNE